MTKAVKVGDHVAWDASQGKVEGRVEKELTSTTRIKGHVAKPSKDEPQYLVRSDKTGAVAAHKPRELRKA
jgi:Hypervirulence associated proteins TUDOR domain